MKPTLLILQVLIIVFSILELHQSININLKRVMNKLKLTRLKRRRKTRLGTESLSKSYFADFSESDYMKRVQEIKANQEKSLPYIGYEKGIRTEKQALLCAYYRLKKFMDYAGNMVRDAYLLNVNLRYSKNQATKIVIGITMDSISGPLDGDLEPTPLFKVCVPADTSKPSYITEKCIFSDCPVTYDLADSCQNKGSNVPINMIPGKF